MRASRRMRHSNIEVWNSGVGTHTHGRMSGLYFEITYDRFFGNIVLMYLAFDVDFPSYSTP
jgi:hypothetical protein